jgi:uncharacterized membrane protein SirB2
MTLLWIKHLHMTLAYVTIAGFAVRGLLSLADSPLLRRRWIRIAPHTVDALLLACGVALAVQLHVDPRYQGWLAAKLVALLAYIGFGIVAMRARRRPVKAACYVAALVSVAYILAVATTKSVVPRWPF